jgi:membrane-bound inhibitor of C-type lysozyme
MGSFAHGAAAAGIGREGGGATVPAPSCIGIRALRSAALALAFAPLLGACVHQGIQQTALPPRVDYACRDDKLVQVARGTDAAIVRFEGRDVTLARQASAAQEKYGNGEWTLYLDGEKAMLESSGRVVAGPCLATVALPEETRRRP